MGAEDVQFRLCFWRRSLLVPGREGVVEGCACTGTEECARERDRESMRSFSRDAAPSFSLPVTGPFNYPFSPSLTSRIAAPPGLICWRWAMALLKFAMYQMSGTGAVASQHFSARHQILTAHCSWFGSSWGKLSIWASVWHVSLSTGWEKMEKENKRPRTSSETCRHSKLPMSARRPAASVHSRFLSIMQQQELAGTIILH